MVLLKLSVCRPEVSVTMHVMEGERWWCRVGKCVAVDGAGTAFDACPEIVAKWEGVATRQIADDSPLNYNILDGNGWRVQREKSVHSGRRSECLAVEW